MRFELSVRPLGEPQISQLLLRFSTHKVKALRHSLLQRNNQHEVSHEKLTVPRLVNYLHCTESQVLPKCPSLAHSIPAHAIGQMLTVSLHPHPDLQNGVSSNLPNKSPHAYLICATNATCHTHLILLDFDAVTIFGSDY
jgi:hypothetical protein